MKAGWIVTLVYLLCILAPPLSYAMPGEHAVVPCMTMEGVMSGSMHMHDEVLQPVHAYLDGAAHEHSSAQPMAMSDQDDRMSMSGAMDDVDVPAKKGPHTTSGQCCALMCVSMMPAPLFEVSAPAVPSVVRIAASYRVAADNAPPEHYRPPIA
ncbi:hypothetical protein AB7783_06925 [Tardiphaga sp. 172_B4_N1_3]|uniref:hypothetical protein n=1 Tax=Tardiphaga sp. 172_B4_N1_3 TaxID=3240787 RepID=UPI003F89814F